MRPFSPAAAATLLLGVCIASMPAFAADDGARGNSNNNTSQHSGENTGGDHKGDRQQAKKPPQKAATGRTIQGSRGAGRTNSQVGAAHTNGGIKGAQQAPSNTSASRGSGRWHANTSSTTAAAPANTRHVENRGAQTHQRADVAQYRRNVDSTRRYHTSAYRAPRGYSYRRWSYGENLPGIYFARDYWLSDFLDYALFAPPEGYVWVRYGPDALLVDEETGEIIQVRYNVFY